MPKTLMDSCALGEGVSDLVLVRIEELLEFKPFKIGKYLLLEKLATGGMAEVYRARASGAGGFEKQLAIKRILPHYSSNDEFRRMFEYEARLSSMLTHANIVQIYDFVKLGDTYLLAMEYVDGKNLRQFVNKVKKMGYSIPIEFAVYVMNEVCKGLEYAHNKKDDLTGKPLNIIHRDMSPQNIMLSYEGSAKIVDFGIAKAKDRVDETRSGVIKGKFGYMSPEQANGMSVDHKTDIFSTAIILYELLTNKRLFAAENDLATLKLIQECVIPRASLSNPKIPHELEKILMKGLSRDMNMRYQNAGQFHRSLQEFLNKAYPSFTQREVSEILHRVFASEIEAEKKRYEQLHRQSIPFSQGSHAAPEEEEGGNELAQVQNALEGTITRSEHEVNTAITFAEEEEQEKEQGSRQDFSASIAKQEEPSLATGSSTDQAHATSTSENTRVESVEFDPPDEGTDSEAQQSDAATIARTQNSSPSDTLPVKEKSVSVLTEVAPPKAKVLEIKEPEEEESQGYSFSEVTQVDDGMPLIGEKSITNVEETNDGHSTNFTQGEPRRSKTESGAVNLQTPNFKGDENQRGSYSLVSQMAKTKGPNVPPTVRNDNSEISKILVEPPKRNARPAQRFEGQTYREPGGGKKRSALPLFVVFGLIGVTVYLYRLLLSGAFTDMLPAGHLASNDENAPRQVAKQPVAEPEATQAPSPVVAGSCSVTIESDPPGATIFIDKEQLGFAPQSFSVKCREAVNITYKKPGYEALSANVVVDRKDQVFQRSLRKVPMGELEFTLDVNAQVIVDDVPMGMASANRPFVIAVRANLKHQIRFVNKVLGLEATQELSVQDGLKIRRLVKLSDPRKTKGKPKY